MKRLSQRLLHPARHRLPLWMKLSVTAFLAVLVPSYWVYYGWTNFLWFSDIALFFAAVTLWTGRRIFACIGAVLALVPEIAWNADFLSGLLFRRHPIGIAEYMWDDSHPRFIRGLSLFHIPLVPLLLYLVYKLGYDRRALPWSLALAWVLLPMTYLLVDPQEKNINWVYGPGDEPQQQMRPKLYLALLMIGLPVLFFVPTHLALSRWRGSRRSR